MSSILEWILKVIMWGCGALFAIDQTFNRNTPENSTYWMALLWIFIITSGILLFVEFKHINWKPDAWQNSKRTK